MPDLKVRGELSLDGQPWENTLQKAEHQTEHFARETLAGVKEAIAGAFAIGSVEEIIRSSIELGETITLNSQRLNLATDKVQEYGYAFGHANKEIGDAANALDKLATASQKALGAGEGAKEMARTFSELGVALEDLKDATPDKLFRDIGEFLSGHDVNKKTTANIREIFGKSGGELIPILKEFGERSEEAHEKGFIVSDADVKTLEKAEGTLKNISTFMKVNSARMVVGWTELLNGGILNAFNPAHHQAQAEEQAANAKIAAMQKTIQFLKDINDPENDPTRSIPSGPAFSKELPADQQKDLDRMQERLHEKNEAHGKTLVQSLEELEAKRASLNKSLAFQQPGTLGFEDITNQLNETGDQIDRLNRSRRPRSTGAGDSLMKVGNFLGKSPDFISRIGEETNRLLRQVVTNTSPGGREARGRFQHGGVPPR